MRLRIVRRGGVLGLAAVAALLAGIAPASAAPGDGSAYGVQVDVTLLGAGCRHTSGRSPPPARPARPPTRWRRRPCPASSPPG